MPESDANAILQLFSAVPEMVLDAQKKFKKRSIETSSLMDELLGKYEEEGNAMPYTMEDFKEYYRKKTLARSTTEQRLEGISFEERLKGVPIEERLKGLPAEERMKDLSVEEIRRILQAKEKGDAKARKR